MKLKPGTIIEITWTDCFGSGCWEDMKVCPPPPVIKTVGFFLQHSHNGIYIAGGLSDGAMEDKVMAPTWIPNGVIRKIRRLK